MAEQTAAGGASLIGNGSKMQKVTQQQPPSAAQQNQMYLQQKQQQQQQHQQQQQQQYQQQSQQQQPQQQQHQPTPAMQQYHQQYHPQILSTGVINGPRTVVLHRHNGDFGFTLRHFIVYPPESCTEPSIAGRLAAVGALNFAQPMDTVFVKKVHQNSPAYFANLQEGDRLLAVNGMPVAGTQYAHVVAAIQQTPKTLTLQVVPKNYDILQTFFSDTAHNPETNQRPLQQQPQQQQQVMYPSMSTMAPAATSTPTAVTTNRNYQPLQQQQQMQQQMHRNVAEKQESLYSTLQDFTVGTNNHSPAGLGSYPEQYYQRPKQRISLQQQQPVSNSQFQKQYNERAYSQQLQAANVSNSECDNNTRLLNNRHQPIHLPSHQQQQIELINRKNSVPSTQSAHVGADSDMANRRESSASISSSTASSYDSRTTLTQNSDLSDSAIMTRLRKSFEQKEEFLRRPSQPYTGSSSSSCNNNNNNNASNGLLTATAHTPSAFYSRPKRLQKQMWPPMTLTTAAIVSANCEQPIYDVPPPPQQIYVDIPKYPQTQHMTQQQLLKEQFLNGGGSSGPTTPTNAVQITTKAICEQAPRDTDEESDTRKPGAVPTPPGLRIVSETTKLFELGRPLSPDGVDRELLYKSELSRLTTKQAHPNVALRRREFELRAENAAWRKSTEDKERCDSIGSDTECRTTKQQQRARSLSADSTSEYTDRFSLDSNLNNGVYHRKQRSREEPYRPKPVRENSYLTAMRNSSAFWLQGRPADFLALSQTPLAIVQDPNNSSLVTALIEATPPSTVSSVHNRELKLAHRNQTIYEVSCNNNRNSVSPNLPKTSLHSATIDEDYEMAAPLPPPRHRPTSLKLVGAPNAAAQAATAVAKPCADDAANAVILRQKQPRDEQPENEIENDDDEDERKMRRISYLRATGHENQFIIDSDIDSPASLPTVGTPDTEGSGAAQQLKSAYKPWRRPRFPTDIQPLRRIFEESPPEVHLPPIVEINNNHVPSPEPQSPTAVAVVAQPSNLLGHGVTKNFFTSSSGTKSKALAYFRDQPADSNDVVVREGDLNIKVTVIDGKRSQDRSWKTVLAELRGNKLKFTLLRDGKSSSQSPEASGIIDLTNFHVADGNYTKRKHVFKLTTSAPGYYSGNSGGSVPTSPNPSATKVSMSTNEREILLQAESLQDLKLWVDSLGKVCRQPEPGIGSDFSNNNNNFGSQTAEPQRIAATTVQSTNDEFSPIMSSKSQRKYGLGSRSPSGQSPVTKSRKTPQSASSTQHQKDGSDKEIAGSPKSKTWKGIMARQFRKIQGQPDSGSSNAETFLLEGASIGVPLLHCPPSEENQYVPLLIARCTSIVESRGLSVIGIYRIPGNTAAISALHELVNRGMDEQMLKDPRWEDVNVVSSLLKLFLRSLPDPLLPNDLYQHFIDADKHTGQRRLIELKSLLKKLPPHSYETLKHLMCHLHRVSNNCVINLMEPRNLAIVFGPSVVRTSNETLETAVKDMKHQCQIVEALVSNYFYFFENDPIPAVIEKDNQSINEGSLTTPSASMLLDNVSKIEQSRDSSSRFVANIVQAANRKIRRSAAQRKSTISSLTPDTMSLESTTSAESKDKHYHPRTTKNTSVSSPIGIDEHQKENMLTPPPTASVVLNRSSEEESSAFTDSGSMSLKTVTITLDNKLRSLRNSSVDSDRDLVTIASDDADDDEDAGGGGDTTNARKSNFINSTPHKPLSLGENIPFADDSPERPLIQARVKPPRHFFTTPAASTTPTLTTPPIGQSKLAMAEEKPPPNDSSPSPSVKSGDDVKSEISSDDTDASTTSNPREKLSSPAILFDTEVLREMNRFLTNLQHTYKRTISLNRSLSLNYKNHKNNECCLHQTFHHNMNVANRLEGSGGGGGINNNTMNNNNNNVNIRARLSLTKDEKTDKNINRRRQLYDSGANNCIINPAAAVPKTYRRYGFANNRSIRRRHTVGGTQDYIPMQKLTSNNHNHHQHAVNPN